MSCDYWFFRPTRDLCSADEIDASAMQFLGTSEDVRGFLSTAYPATRWSITAGILWGSLILDGERLEIMLGEPSAIQTAISVRASRRSIATEALQKLSNSLQMACLDKQTMSLIKPNCSVVHVSHGGD